MKHFSHVTAFLVLFVCQTAGATQVAGTAGVWGRHVFPYIPPETRFGYVEGGENVTYALSTNGHLYFWGEGYNLPYVESNDTNTYVAVTGRGWGNAIGLRADGKLMSIGRDGSVPEHLTNVISIAASQTHYMALLSDGTVWDQAGHAPAVFGAKAIAAGDGLSVVLFSNGTAQAWAEGGTFESFPDDLDNIVGIAAGGDHVGLLRNDGTVTVWDGEAAPDHLTNVISIVSGETYFLALKSDGTVEGWGWAESGETDIPAGLSNVVRIASGVNHSLALKSDGSIVAWGDNLYGQSVVPEQMQNVVSVAGGWGFSILAREDGSVMAIGRMGLYEETVPLVPAGLSNIVKVAAGEAHALALKEDGTVAAWGNNSSGQCNVPAGLNNVTAIAAGAVFSGALKADGTVVTWGSLSSTIPKPANLTNVITIAAGSDHIVALKNDGTVAVWGSNDEGQCEPPEDLERTVAVDAAGEMCLGLTEGGTVKQWGSWDDSMPSMTNVVKMTYGVFVTADGTIAFWGWDASETDLELPAKLFWISGISVGPDNRMLIVSGPRRPFMIEQPQGGDSYRGQLLVLDCIADGPHPLSYQWQKDGTNIPGATNRSMVLEHIEHDAGGAYRVVITNLYGSIGSGFARVDVRIPPAIQVALGDAFFWQTGGSAEWLVQSEHSIDGSAVQSGRVLAGQESWIETTVYGIGVLNYHWRMSSSDQSGWLRVSINGTDLWEYYDGPEWQSGQLYPDFGKNVVRWTFFNATPRQNAAWLDQVSFVPEYPAGPFTMLSGPSNEGLSFQIQQHIEDEEEPLLERGYVIQASTNLLDWLSLTCFSSEETLLLATDTNSPKQFYRAVTP